MQQALMSKLLPSTHKPFENVEGFPDCPSADKIAKMSVVAKDSDYVFIKLLMYAIWPDGFMGKSVTARTSNNPKGRGKKDPPIDDDRAHVDERASTGRTALEKNKV
ncbi:AAEL004395-PA [Aedes aegypti]|uniref:AAEL004395-PA n=1 Tax=Aedes aegypti TaxID=7159 RepID=Q17CX6_AEDAE|nr:AAEL004395-PA [Aedes aegypti]